MSATPSPPLLRALAGQRTLWLAVPAVALLVGLVLLGKSAVSTPEEVSKAPSSLAAASTPLVQEVSSSATLATNAAGTGEFSADQKKQIEKIIKDYLVSNPEIFLEAQSALEAKMEKEQAEKLKTAIAQNAREIYRDPNADVAGNANGDITVVEFFDYNCGYCKRGLHDVVKLVETDPRVRVVFKELPILSKGSEEASRAAIAAGKQGKYWQMHRAMLEAKGAMNEANALAIATKLGLDIDKLKKDMASPEVEAEIKKSEALAKKMGVNGTPHFLVGDRAIPGAPEDLYDQLEKHVSELRKSGCSYC